jgi:hypothetical protein
MTLKKTDCLTTSFFERVYSKSKILRLIKDYPSSVIGGIRNRRIFDSVETYCMFIGYPRSGHSLIGALIEAHPEAIVCHELGAMMYIHAGFSRSQLFYLLLERSRKFKRENLLRGGFQFELPNQWQGRFRNLKVIGDKNGHGAALRLKARPWLLYRLKKKVNCNVKIIHVIRNPFDTISTLLREKDGGTTLEDCADYYFSFAEAIKKIRDNLEENSLLELKHEDFIKEPALWLGRICRFLSISEEISYIEDCSGIIYDHPHKSRLGTKWSHKMINSVSERIRTFPFLKHYNYYD